MQINWEWHQMLGNENRRWADDECTSGFCHGNFIVALYWNFLCVWWWCSFERQSPRFCFSPSSPSASSPSYSPYSSSSSSDCHCGFMFYVVFIEGVTEREDKWQSTCFFTRGNLHESIYNRVEGGGMLHPVGNLSFWIFQLVTHRALPPIKRFHSHSWWLTCRLPSDTHRFIHASMPCKHAAGNE